MADELQIWEQAIGDLRKRFRGLGLVTVEVVDGKTCLEASGDLKAVEEFQDIRNRPIIRHAFREAAKDQEWCLDELKDPGWPAAWDVVGSFMGPAKDPPLAESKEEVLRKVASEMGGILDEESGETPVVIHTSRGGALKRVASEIGDLLAKKNRAYGDSFNVCGEALRLLYPMGIRPDQYGDLLALVRIWDKMMRIATDRDALGESPYRDVAGYGILGAERVERERKERK